MRVIRIGTSLLVVLALLTGCSTRYMATRSLVYAPLPVEADHRPPRGLLVVRQFAEARSERSYPSQLGRTFMTYIPLLPYVKVPYERLDESDRMTRAQRGEDPDAAKSFTESFARAVATDLAESGLFAQVRYVGEGAIPANADYVLEGELRSSELDAYITSYMLGAAGVLLWLLPIPFGKLKAQADVDLVLRDRTGAVLLSDRLVGTGSKLFTFYNSGGAAISSRLSLEITRYGSNDEGIDGDSLWAYHASALRSGMGEVKKAMTQVLTEPRAAGSGAADGMNGL